MEPSLWLIGAGTMAQAYSAVLQAQGVQFRVVGRSHASAKTFHHATGVSVLEGGLEAALAAFEAPKRAIVAVNVKELTTTAHQLLAVGTKHLLLEKPGALSIVDLIALHADAQERAAHIWIAYNRRFYASVERLRQLVAADGGIKSAMFEFTEWSHRIRIQQIAPCEKKKWLLANSSHVIDLAFYLIGLPAKGQWKAWQSGELDWHPTAARFHGAGVSERNISFSYQADWEAPGRWGIELLTRHNRYLLRPLEALQAIPLGSIESHQVDLNDYLDHQFKPGLFRQCEAFLGTHPGKAGELCSLEDQLDAFSIYYRIAGYTL